MSTNFHAVTGVYTGRSIQPRNIFKSGTPQYFPSNLASLDATKSRDTSNTSLVSLLQAGTLLGKITSGGKYRPTIIGLTAAISAATVTSITVTAATATEVARLIVLAGTSVSLKLIGPPSAAGTVASTSITCSAASGTTLTITSVALPAYVANSLVTPADGAESPRTFVTNAYGLSVVDVIGGAVDHPVDFIRNADINTDMIPNYSSLDASLLTYLKAAIRTNNPGAVLTFSDDR